jgi:hypothetical protein
MSTPPPPPPGSGAGDAPAPDPARAPGPAPATGPAYGSYRPPGDYRPPAANNGMAVGALVTGIIALICGLLAPLIVTAMLAFVLGIVAIVLGILGIQRAREIATGRGQSITGIVTGSLALLALLGWVVVAAIFWTAVVDEFGDPFDDPEAFQERLEEFDELDEFEDTQP